MNEPRFTPGPWERDGRTVYALEQYGEARYRNRFDLNVQSCTTPKEELIAVATLVQAAPELYSALARLVVQCEAENEVAGYIVIDLHGAEYALSKARGETTC